ncbi:MAG: beta strand repeat-containing protein [Phototrophicaceae bacterium]
MIQTSKFRYLLYPLLALLLGLTLGQGMPVQAATLSVNSEAALRSALTNPTSGTIIRITADIAMGGNELTVALPVNIQIIGVTSDITITATSNNRIFNITSAGAYVLLYNLELVGSGALATGDGGVIRNSGTLVMENVEVSGGTVTSGNGGGIYSTGPISISNSYIHDNNAPAGNGGGIALVSSSSGLTLNTSVQIQDNSAILGGGVYLDQNGGSSSVFGQYSDNQAQSGGGLFATRAIVQLDDRSSFTNNTANTAGGAIFIDASSTLNLRNTAIYDNQVLSGNGGGLGLASSSRANIVNTTFDSNVASSNGGAVFNQGTVAASFVSFINNGGSNSLYGDTGSANSFRNSIFYRASGTVCAFASGITLTNRSGNIDSGTSCGLLTGNNVDPLFGASDRFVTPLTSTSPALDGVAICTLNIDTTDSSPYSAAATLRRDQRGLTRPQNTQCDIGAFELEATSGFSEGVNIVQLFEELSEDGLSLGYYYVVLTSPPANDVTITASLTSSYTGQALMRGNSVTGAFDTTAAVTFTPLNWFTPQTIAVQAVDDSTIEADPHSAAIRHDITDGDGASYQAANILPRQLQFDIAENDGLTNLYASILPANASVNVTEGNNVSATVTVTLSRPLASTESPVTVILLTDSVIAVPNSDYNPSLEPSNVLTFTTGGSTTQTVSVPIINDTNYEGTESFLVYIDSVYSVLGGRRDPNGNDTALVTLTDDEPAPTTFVIPNGTLPTGIVNVTYQVAFLPFSGAVSPYTWSIVGTLPTGFSFSNTTGILSGISTTPVSFSFTVVMQDSSSPSKRGEGKYTVNITANGLLPGQVATAVPQATLSADQAQATQTANVINVVG